MVNTIVDKPDVKSRKMRSSRDKHSKVAIERRRRLRNAGLWLLLMVVGAALVAGIAVVLGGGLN